MTDQPTPQTPWASDDDGDHSAWTHRDDDEPPPYQPTPQTEARRDARKLRAQVIREITVAPGWNKEDATALVDELILSLPYIDDKNALREPAQARTEALDVEVLDGLLRKYDRRQYGDPQGCIAVRLWDLHAIAREYAAILAAKP